MSRGSLAGASALVAALSCIPALADTLPTPVETPAPRAHVTVIGQARGVSTTKPAGEAGADGPPGVEVLHLGNEGFLVGSGEQKVLVDALQGSGIKNYVTLSSSRRETMEKALPPYDGVDLILATHRHDDHFNPWSVGRYLERSPGSLFVSTTQSVERMHGFPGYDAIADRVRGFDPQEGKPVTLEHAGIPVTLLDLHHGRGRDVDNLAFVFDVGGVRFLHVGDTVATAEEFARYRLVDMKIDVAMLPSWIIAGTAWPDHAAAIGARHVVAMHIPSADAPANYFGGDARNRADYLDWLRSERPEAILFWKPFQKRRFAPAAR